MAFAMIERERAIARFGEREKKERERAKISIEVHKKIFMFESDMLAYDGGKKKRIYLSRLEGRYTLICR